MTRRSTLAVENRNFNLGVSNRERKKSVLNQKNEVDELISKIRCTN